MKPAHAEYNRGIMMCNFVFALLLSDKMGVCPAPIEDRPDCSTECSVDHDCDGELKCCQQPCGRICVEPDMKGKSVTFAYVNKKHLFWLCRRVIESYGKRSRRSRS